MAEIIHFDISLGQSTLRTLIYFDLFDYPLTPFEIRQFMDTPIESEEELYPILSHLAEKKQVFKLGEFFSIRNQPHLAKLRKERNDRAAQLMVKAKKMTRIISRFPFVRMVSLSGSLSKNCAYPDSDIDFFIIAKEGRVWVTRFLLMLYKKTILLNNPRYFCTNLILGDGHLHFDHQSHYIATEIVSVLPMTGIEVYRNFMISNNWTTEFFPNAQWRDNEIVWPQIPKPWFAKGLELILNNQVGDWLDRAWMKITRWKWAKDHKGNQEVMENGKDFIDIQPHLVKGHGGDQHPRIRKNYEEALSRYFQQES